MCIGIPMLVKESEGFFALCEGRGDERRLNMMLVGPQEPGTWVLAFIDHAKDVLTEEEAATINDALDALDASLAGEDMSGFFADLRRDDEIAVAASPLADPA